MSNRFFTTSKAEIFSVTNNIFFSLANSAAIKLAIVWDFPVPGGPIITKLLPLTASINALCWELSASNTRGNFVWMSLILSIS